MEKRHVGHSMGFDTYDIYYNATLPVKGLSVVPVDAQYIFTPTLHRHRFYELFINIEGKGVHHVDFEAHDIFPGYIYCIRPGQLHRIAMTSVGLGYIVMFNSDFLMSYSPLCRPDHMDYFLSTDTFKQIPLSQRVVSLSEFLFQTQSSVHNLKSLLSASFLTAILVEIQQQYDSSSLDRTPYTSISDQFIKLLSSTLPPRKSVQEYSKKMNIHASYLNSVVKKDTGKTAGTWIQETRLLEAKRMLTHSDVSIEGISTILQFSESSAFCRFFKIKTRMTPLEFRMQFG